MQTNSRSFFAALVGSAFALAALHGNAQAAAGYKVFHSFDQANGAWPGSLVFDKAGDIIGSTEVGGSSNCGAIYKLTPDGTYTVLHMFSGSDGCAPEGFHFNRQSGRIVGNAVDGGREGACHGFGCGLLYSLEADGTETTLHIFHGKKDGQGPYTPVHGGHREGLFGVTDSGGPTGLGTIWNLRGRHLTVLHAFNDTDGAYPSGRLLKGLDGNFYGTTIGGGGKDYAGVIYRISPEGAFETLRKLDFSKDGAHPYELIQDGAGNLYGSATGGGAGGLGTVFKVTPDGAFSVLHAFTNSAEGNHPGGLLLVGSVLYGMTYLGGDPNCNCGVIFKLGMDGKEEVLHTFTGGANDGAYASGGLTLGPDGLLYGTTTNGGTNNLGTLFQLKK